METDEIVAEVYEQWIQSEVAYVFFIGGLSLILLLFYLRVQPLAVPMPAGSTAFLGHVLQVQDQYHRMQDWLLETTLLFGGETTWGLQAPRIGHFPRGILILATPECVKHILKTNFSNYEKGPYFKEIFYEMLGDGIFNSDGHIWKQQRKTAVHMFSRRLLRNGTEVALANAKVLCEKISEFASTDTPFDLQKLFYNFTIDTFGTIAFGINLNSQNKPHEFTKAFDQVQSIVQKRFRNPLWKFLRFFGTKKEMELKTHLQTLRTFATSVIQEKKKTYKATGLGKDLISLYIDAALKTKSPLPTNRNLSDIIFNFIIAGRDTTAVGMSWTMLELLRHPEHVQKIREEIKHEVAESKTVTGIKKTENKRFLGDLANDALFEILNKKLPYTKAVVSESLRLHPPVPRDIKYAVNADVLPDGTRVPSGTAVIYCPYALGRNPKIWPKPLEFKPDRWLKIDNESPTKTTTSKVRSSKQTYNEPDDIEVPNNSSKKPQCMNSSLYRSQVSDFKYPTFNAGPRLCLGRPLAYLEMELVLGMILSKFDIKAVGPDSLKGAYAQTVVPPIDGGLWVRAKKAKKLEI